MSRRSPIALVWIVTLGVIVTGMAWAIPWPFVPNDQQRPLGNSYGEYQDYGGWPYFHPGTDILQPAGTPVHAVRSGWVKAVLTTSGVYYWRVAVGDSIGEAPCDGWLYAHLDQGTIQVLEGDYVIKGDYLGNLVAWPTAGFHHLHFVKVRDSGETWPADWAFVGNPMDGLEAVVDTSPPSFTSVGEDVEFAFMPDNTHDYYAPGATISGSVDIIARVQDRVEHPTWELTPAQVTYEIRNDTMTTGEIVSVAFTGRLFWEENVAVVYQDDATYDTKGDYDDREYYFIVTNTDGDSVIESGDTAGSWRTQDFNNGTWWVKVRAYDHGGNVAVDSMSVMVANYFPLSGRIGMCDGDPDSAGISVEAPDLPGAPVVLTDAHGAFDIDSALLGARRLVISRPSYRALDTVAAVPGGTFVADLVPDYLVGDLNADREYTVVDVVRLIEIVFRGSSTPAVPYWSADLDFDRQFTVTDVVHLIDHVFRGASPPATSRCYP